MCINHLNSPREMSRIRIIYSPSFHFLFQNFKFNNNALIITKRIKLKLGTNEISKHAWTSHISMDRATQ